ncbi:hypothetical protein EMGBS15_07170 [Filimonas sp.]|nr:hypothetical protein EMGBS15_07170 [Filimonas sp.]
MQKQLIECVPNFSEGINMDIINKITDEIEKGRRSEATGCRSG